jgi:hypothetical protein
MSQAMERSDLSRVHLAQLLRNGSLEGFQLSGVWFVYADSLEKFLASPRKSGPKGPIKKRVPTPSDKPSTTHENP